MAVFENEKQTLQGSEYYAHLNRNWDNGNKQFDAMNARINAKAENSAPGEVIQARIDANGNVYKSLAGRLDANQKVAENASYIANSAYTYAKTELYKKLSQMNNGVKAFADINKLKQAYPNGSDGIFVTVDTGHQWYYVDGLWRDAGIYQASSYDSELRDARVELDGTNANTIGNAIRDQFFKEKKERIADLNAESIERSKADAQIEDRLNLAETALELKETKLVDNFGNFLVDGSNFITGNVVLPKTDSTGLEVGVPADSGSVGYTFLGHLKEYGLPILELEHPDLLSLKTKADGKLSNVKFEYNFNNGIDGDIKGVLKTIGIQGSGAQRYIKKNYTLKLNQNIQFKKNWGSHDKYVIKADWVDFSQLRNEIGASLWGDIRKTRLKTDDNVLVDKDGNQFVRTEFSKLTGEIRPQFAMGMNLGAIDSYPIFVIINGVYHGLYSFTVPKDDWMAGMGQGEKEAIVSSTQALSTRFKAPVGVDSSGNLHDRGFELEYVSDEKKQDWVPQSLNKLINAIQSNTGVDQYLDIDSAIDYLIMNLLDANQDAVDRNWLLDTWDGKKWTFAAYDMDSTFGNYWDGAHYDSPSAYDLNYHTSISDLYKWIVNNHKDDLISRWDFLRTNVLNDYTLFNKVYNFALKIPSEAYTYEGKRWPGRPGTTTNNHNQIITWLSMRTKFLDEMFNKLK